METSKSEGVPHFGSLRSCAGCKWQAILHFLCECSGGAIEYRPNSESQQTRKQKISSKVTKKPTA